MSSDTKSVNCFIDLRWGQDDDEPYLVPVPRIPCVGELFIGPDDFGSYAVTRVTFLYDRGFYFPPSRIIVDIERTETQQ